MKRSRSNSNTLELWQPVRIAHMGMGGEFNFRSRLLHSIFYKYPWEKHRSIFFFIKLSICGMLRVEYSSLVKIFNSFTN